MGNARKESLVITVTNELKKLIGIDFILCSHSQSANISKAQAGEDCTASHFGIDPSSIRFDWVFKEFYPRFPSSYDACQPLPRDIESWTEWELDLCITAMIRKYFYCEASTAGNQIPGKTHYLKRYPEAPADRQQSLPPQIEEI